MNKRRNMTNSLLAIFIFSQLTSIYAGAELRKNKEIQAELTGNNPQVVLGKTTELKAFGKNLNKMSLGGNYASEWLVWTVRL